MLDKYNSHTRKKPDKLFIYRRDTEAPSTGSLENILPPPIKKYITGTNTNGVYWINLSRSVYRLHS